MKRSSLKLAPFLICYTLFFHSLPAQQTNLATSTTEIPSTASIKIDGRDKGRLFDGIGALSAGASSRLLIDYPEPQRSEILDYLFKPNFGAALQINKVEIGGDMNSTDGSEPSHMRTRDDENYQRGYEWWLMEESKKRNPNIKLYGLEWGAPNWINPLKNDVWTPENITYILNWVRHAKSDHNLSIDYLGGWNEKGFNAAWYEQFREALNQAGMVQIKIAADDSFSWNVGHAASKDPKFAASFEIIGEHYPKIPNEVTSKTYAAWQESLATGKPLWGSEIGWSNYGSTGLGKTYNQGYVDAKMTSFINWSTVWSVLPGLPFSGDGLMLADEPWSGHYVVGLSIWITAHTTQFAQPGWQYLDGACGYFGGNYKNGSYVALRSPSGKDFSLIAETIDGKVAQTATFMIRGGLDSSVLHVWRTNTHSHNTKDWFVEEADVTPENGSFTMTFDPGCLYSITTTTGQTKGRTTPPPSASLPLPYKDDFQQYALGKTPRYFSDQHGAFEIAPATGGREGKCLRQVVLAKPISWNSDADPGTLIGDLSWKNYRITSDILLEQPGYVELIGRFKKAETQNVILGYHFRLQDTGHWSLYYRAYNKPFKSSSKEIAIASGDVPTFSGVGHWHKLSLSFSGNKITAAIDGLFVVNDVVDSNAEAGLAGYQVSRWENAEFMNFEVLPDDSTLSN